VPCNDSSGQSGSNRPRCGHTVRLAVDATSVGHTKRMLANSHGRFGHINRRTEAMAIHHLVGAEGMKSIFELVAVAALIISLQGVGRSADSQRPDKTPNADNVALVEIAAPARTRILVGHDDRQQGGHL
jgi:hypothetical protein